ncbi:MAG: SGNH hydrolase domain-containing protein [Chloroflexota bacterium]
MRQALAGLGAASGDAPVYRWLVGRFSRARGGVALALACCLLPGALTTSAASGDRDGDGLRDSWEQRWGVTSQRVADNDGDGIPDSAEDPDYDGLSNLGEQRFGTSPQRVDTDRDGISDWREDGNRNGTSNGREQDRRRLPTGLRPTLAQASEDTPLAGREACHARGSDAEIHPCVFGDRRGSVRVVLYGDSHAAAWLGALDRAGRSHHWRVTSITKSACPSAHVRFVHPNHREEYQSCVRWRENAERWIGEHPHDLVIVTNHRGYDLQDESNATLQGPQADDAWRRGIEEAIGAIDGRVLVLGDLPTPGRDVPACLKAHRTNIARCARSRAASVDVDHAAAERAAAESWGATYRSPAAAVCPYDPCPVVVGTTLVWRDKHHITATFSRQLAPMIRRFVRAALDG